MCLHIVFDIQTERVLAVVLRSHSGLNWTPIDTTSPDSSSPEIIPDDGQDQYTTDEGSNTDDSDDNDSDPSWPASDSGSDSYHEAESGSGIGYSSDL